jgi:anti-sigma factor RsiW
MTKMGRVDERTEHLIVRWLDGEADDQERAELASLLAHDAAAKQLLEEYGRNDDLARRAIEELVSGPARVRVGQKRRWRMWVGWAAAAVVALGLLWPVGMALRRDVPSNQTAREPNEATAKANEQPGPAATDGLECFGIYDDVNDRLYLLEPPASSGYVVTVSGEL